MKLPPVARTGIAMTPFIVLAGCGGPAYVLTRLGTSPAKPPGCEFIIASTKVDKPYEEVAILDYKNQVATSAGEFQTLIGPLVCEVGGDAVIPDINGRGWYVRGTVVRWKAAAP